MVQFKALDLIDPLTLLVPSPKPPPHKAQAQVPVDIVASVAQSKSVSRRFMLRPRASSAITLKK
tara:strand:- start:141 stop:332 length:192 start_codon:yes stop_codon:yes gene_type:complete